MPTSDLSQFPYLVQMVIDAAPKTVLDVGPGYGKAGILLREYVPTIEVLDAVEVEPSYITNRLRCLYDIIFLSDVRDLSDERLRFYDLVFMADVIEHLEKDEGLKLLDRIRGWVVISTPKTFFENPPTVPSEVHRSLWTESDFGERADRIIDTGMDAWMVRLRPTW